MDAISSDLREASEMMRVGSDPTRLRVLMVLSEGAKYVGELVDLLQVSQTTISHHLSTMRVGKYVDMERRGHRVYYGLAPKGRVLAEMAISLLP
jgi:DNA-binding transcriptional ArsR family regulator